MTYSPSHDPIRSPPEKGGSRLSPVFQDAYASRSTRYTKDDMSEQQLIEQSYREACPLFISSFDALADYINDWAERKGWNDDDPTRYKGIVSISGGESCDLQSNFEIAACVAHDISKLGLMITELCEAIEGRRHGDKASDKIITFSSQEEELADCIVRIMHYAKQRNLRVAEALIEKMRYNEQRPYKHGKQA